VAKATEVEHLFKQALEAFGKVDVVVHSQGRSTPLVNQPAVLRAL
jgi:NAD(P)-dependent dehydrogenase (short-subunit alcohol dehydrogenase family)